MSELRRHASIGFVAFGMASLAACRSRDSLPFGPTTTSPQASAEPVPLEHSLARVDDAKESPGVLTREVDGSAEPVAAEGAGLTYDMQWSEGSFAARMGDTSAATLDALRRRSSTSLNVVATGSRAALTIAGPRTLFPPGFEMRAQAEHRGYTLVEAAEKRFMEAPDGVWRSLLNDGRLDVSPLRAVAAPDLPAKGPGPSPHERTLTLTTKSATLTLTVAPGGDGQTWGTVVARAFCELAGMSPDGALLADGEWPKRAELQWSSGRTLRFATAAKVARLVEPNEVVAAPTGFHVARRALPIPSSRAFLTQGDFATLRGAAPDGTASEGSALWLVNRDVAPRVALIEGVPVGWIAGNQSLSLEGLRPGRYAIRWLSPLGELDSGDGVAAAPGVVAMRATASP